MQARFKRALQRLVPALDVLSAPLTVVAAWWLKKVRRRGVHRMPVARAILSRAGVFPIRDHYYEPLFQTQALSREVRERRCLPGIDFDDAGQLALLEQFHYQEELRRFPLERGGSEAFYYNNGTFEAGDAEYYYSILRRFRPAQVIEVGAGYSTLMARAALAQNAAEDPRSLCRHLCIEPHENPWLERSGAQIVRQKLESIDLALFRSLEANDVLFLDSTHMIRPQGDVLREYLEILPALQPGVLVQIHDIFTPRDYPDAWLIDEVRFWNEQYLVEAFLTENRRFRIIGALNYLKHKYPAQVYARLPVLAAQPQREPGSLWIRS